MNYRFTITIIYILIAGLFGILPAVKATPGDLDTSFSTDGIVTQEIGSGGNDNGYATAIQSDGKIIVAGSVVYGSQNICSVTRYNSNGSLDTTFDGDGKAFVSINVSFFCTAAAIQSDGKIVAAGYGSNGSNFDFEIARFNTDGSLDTSFDTDGKLATAVGSSDDYGKAIAIQSDGKIVVAGRSFNSGDDFSVVRYNTDGSLDTSFDTDGKVITPVMSWADGANAVAVQSDGKIVVAGRSSNGSNDDFALLRYNTNGSLDTSFDTDGKVTTNIWSNTDSANAVVIQSDGKIVAVGNAYTGSNDDFAVVRYNTNGSLDSGFGNFGRVTTAVLSSYDNAFAAAIQSDGKIIAAGYSSTATNDDFALVRYNTNGTLDTSFDTDGKVTTPILSSSETVYGLAIQSGGEIVAAGNTFNGSNYDFSLARYNTNGSLDTTFDTDGKTNVNVGCQSSAARATAIQADGKIVAVGFASNGSNTDFAVIRYNTDGSPDTTFDGDGKVMTAIGSSYESAYAVAIQSDGKIVVAGYAEISYVYKFAVVRYNSDGSLDTSFDSDGKLTTDILSSTNIANAVAIQADGKIVAAGSASNGSNTDFAVVRYNTNGSLDTSFDTDGKLTTGVLSSTDVANAVAIQSDGKIIAAGYSYGFSNSDFAVVRYNTNGSLDTSFDTDGKVTTAVLSANDAANAVAIQADGKIVAAGQSSNGSNDDFALVRYNTNGSLDTSFDTDGKVTTAVLSSQDNAYALAIQTDGQIIAAGRSLVSGTNYNFALARYNTNGSLDTSFGTSGKATLDILAASNDAVYSIALDSSGNAVVAGEAGGLFTVARLLPF